MSELTISIPHTERSPKVVSGSWYIIYSMVSPASVENGVVDKENLNLFLKIKFFFSFEECFCVAFDICQFEIEAYHKLKFL